MRRIETPLRLIGMQLLPDHCFDGEPGISSTKPVMDFNRPSLPTTPKSVPTKCNGASFVPPASHWNRNVAVDQFVDVTHFTTPLGCSIRLSRRPALYTRIFVPGLTSASITGEVIVTRRRFTTLTDVRRRDLTREAGEFDRLPNFRLPRCKLPSSP